MKQNNPKENKKESKTESKTRLVYSSDGSHLKLCKKCGEDPCLCVDSIQNIMTIDPAKHTLKLKLEKNGRGGKLVTVLFDLPFNPDYFLDLSKKLKTTCGTGGTFINKAPLKIELQGDQREKCELFLQKMGFKTKRAGG